MKHIVVLVAFALAGCVTARQMTMPSGAHGEAISCNGIQHSMADCFERAGDDCPAGYDVVGGDQESQPFIASNGGFRASRYSAQGNYQTLGGSRTKRSLMVTCH
jgi:hypothetical protein